MSKKHLVAVPVSLKEANEFVLNFHRHSLPTNAHGRPGGGKFAIGASTGSALVGVAIVGRPVARMLQDGVTAEVVRTCTVDDAPKGTNSFLYSRCWRAWRAMGGRRMVTYTLATESGASLRGAGWQVVGEVKPQKSPWQGPDRARRWNPIYGQLKMRWEVTE